MYADIQLSKHHLVWDNLFPHCVSLTPLSEINNQKCKDLFLNSQFCFIGSNTYPVANTPITFFFFLSAKYFKENKMFSGLLGRKWLYILLLQFKRNISQLHRFPVENFIYNLVIKNKQIMFGFSHIAFNQWHSFVFIYVHIWQKSMGYLTSQFHVVVIFVVLY